MRNWLKRQQDRQRELERGVDADLVHGNRRRFRVSFRLLAAGTVLALAARYLPGPPWARRTLTLAASGCLVCGFILFKWAMRERAFLNEPGPEEPPKLFKP